MDKAMTGTVPAGANVNGGTGLKTVSIPNGIYSGSQTAPANDFGRRQTS